MDMSTLDELYFNWLVERVGDSDSRNPRRRKWKLLRQLYSTEFVWLVPNDDNRAEEGKYLRWGFVDANELIIDEQDEWMQLGCSMLEMLVALAKRYAFLNDEDIQDKFWEMLKNAGLDKPRMTEQYIENVIDRIIWRTYDSSGRGGLFPLEHSEKDQRAVELWYQLNEYASR